MVEYAAKAGADRVELYTEPYATDFPKNPEAAIAPFIEAAKTARKLGIGLNAGHDLSLVNLNYFYKQFSSQFGGLPADYRKQYQESKKKI